MHVQDGAREARQEPGREDRHVAREHDEPHPVRVEPVGDRRVARRPVGVLVEREDGGRHPGRPRPLERAGRRLVGGDGDDDDDDADPLAFDDPEADEDDEEEDDD